MAGRILQTNEGSYLGDFRLVDWAQLALTAMIFGSAFLWIALALRSFSPAIIGFGRVALGALALSVIPAARRRIEGGDLARIAIAGVVGQAAPAVLFAMAQQRIDSAVSGMLVSAIPIATAVIGTLITRQLPVPRRRLGLLVGFVGIVLVGLPDLTGASAGSVGVAMVLAAVAGYGLAANLYAPLQQRYGALAVTFWTLTTASVVLAPFAVRGLTAIRPSTLSVVALLVLGVIGTGAVRALQVSLIGRVGAQRASIVAYFVPIIALILGVMVLDESVEWIQVVGVAVAVTGGWLVSRGEA